MDQLIYFFELFAQIFFLQQIQKTLPFLDHYHLTHFFLVQTVVKLHLQTRRTEAREISPPHCSIRFGEKFIPITWINLTKQKCTLHRSNINSSFIPIYELQIIKKFVVTLFMRGMEKNLADLILRRWDMKTEVDRHTEIHTAVFIELLRQLKSNCERLTPLW